jgi:hypothetical protein
LQQEHTKTYTLQSRPGHKDVGVKGAIEVKIIIKDKNSKKDKEKKGRNKSNRSKRATTSAVSLPSAPTSSPALGSGSPEVVRESVRVRARLRVGGN